ncbi:hypothetical protein GCM10023195_34610 [Actinoallomurus liliacearum]|uniref:Gfo/Idh/MocA-like oxidoreductase N-terminal domain-containing protein n=1 Tax=Actinoallomurus liliacearum TaxID=1080073 RepID=A0ABP8TLT9_9ACTN
MALAEPDPGRRAAAAEEFGAPSDRVHADWSDLAAQERLADAAIVATQDRQHTGPAVRLADRGYHILLADSSKLDRTDLALVCPLADIHLLITGDGTDEAP